MQLIFLFPGLGADHRLFAHTHIPGAIPRVTEMRAPARKETLEDYCKSMLQNIPDDEKLVFIGVSFGGILAQEISKLRQVKKIILISSVSTRRQFPAGFTLLRIFPIFKILPDTWLKQLIVWIGRTFTHKSETEQKVFEAMVRDADTGLIRWGIQQTIHWKQSSPVPGIIHIHGSKDPLFPCEKIKPAYVIEGGEHFIIFQRAEEINKLLQHILQGDSK
jgi:pimeloyl-ACP methyl ester carboxylesterase